MSLCAGSAMQGDCAAAWTHDATAATDRPTTCWQKVSLLSSSVNADLESSLRSNAASKFWTALMPMRVTSRAPRGNFCSLLCWPKAGSCW